MTSEAFLQLGERLLVIPPADFSPAHQKALQHILTVSISETTATTLTPDSVHLTLLTSAMGSSLGGVSVEAVRRIGLEMFGACSEDVKRRLVTLLLDAGGKTKDPALAAEVKKQLKQVRA